MLDGEIQMSLFNLGRCVATPGALALLAERDMQPVALLARHSSGDWGDVGKDDAKANVDALKFGARIFSVYDGLWVITEADRASTTILLPSEY